LPLSHCTLQFVETGRQSRAGAVTAERDGGIDSTGGARSSVASGSHRFQDEKRITIVTLQTLVNEYEKYSAGYFDMVVIDECHRSIYGQWRRALDHFDAIKLGLTATPCVMRDAPDVDEEDRQAIRDTLRFFEVSRPTYSYTVAEAIADGHLAPYEIYRAMTARTAATDGFAVTRAEIDWGALDEATRAELEALFADRDPLIVDPAVLERKFTIPERNRAMVREFREVLENGYTGPNRMRRAPDWGKTIVFAVTKRHAETLARMLDQEFADKRPSTTIRYADFVISGLGPDDTVDAKAKIERFKKEGIPADPGQREHAGHRLRLPGGSQSGDGAVHAQLDPLPTDAWTGHPPVAGKEPLHDVRLYRGYPAPWR
jgi:type I restriction enzyme R subunit